MQVKQSSKFLTIKVYILNISICKNGVGQLNGWTELPKRGMFRINFSGRPLFISKCIGVVSSANQFPLCAGPDTHLYVKFVNMHKTFGK